MGSQTIPEQEDALFAEWSAGRSGFVPDGIADETAFLSTKPSLVFLLKEVNDTRSGGGWDLRRFLKEGARSSTWTNVTRWVRAIRALPEATPWSDLREVTQADRVATLASIAAVNLKKTPGTHTADPAAIEAAAKTDAAFLRRQLALYQADLIVCCGSVVARGLHGVLKPQGSWRTTTRGVRFLEYAPGRHAIEYSHPEARVAEHLLCYGLVDAVRELRFDR